MIFFQEEMKKERKLWEDKTEEEKTCIEDGCNNLRMHRYQRCKECRTK